MTASLGAIRAKLDEDKAKIRSHEEYSKQWLETRGDVLTPHELEQQRLEALADPDATDEFVADTEAVAADGYRLTDVGNSARLVELAAGRLRYVHKWSRWIVYTDGRWVVDAGDALVTERAKQVARSLFALSVTLDGDTRKRVFSWAIHSETSHAITSMIKLARGTPGIITEHEDLDADPHLLNVLNGTVDLRTGKLLPHNPDDLMTLQAPVRFDPTADAPLWRACLERWQPDPDVREYIQREAGAGATGHPTETLSVHHGGGGNGKSKFFGAVQHVLGDYAVVPHKSLLVAQRHEQHETVKAELFRRRLAVASETKAVDVLDDEKVKALTGGDRMRARRMREDPWSFEPSHTLALITNFRPEIQGRDEAIWRRVRLIPWAVTIPADERDPELADKLRDEAPGILNWIVEGAMRFLADGFDPPAVVQAATASYRADEDVVGRFMADALRFGSGWARASEIKDELERWCDDQGVVPPRMNEVAAELANVRLRTNSLGQSRLDHDAGGHDDQAVAIALAAHHLIERGGGNSECWLQAWSKMAVEQRMPTSPTPGIGGSRQRLGGW